MKKFVEICLHSIYTHQITFQFHEKQIAKICKNSIFTKETKFHENSWENLEKSATRLKNSIFSSAQIS